MTIDKIPIGTYTHTITGKHRDLIEIKLKNTAGLFLKDGDIITLDMIEPYESVAVRKVVEYISDHLNLEYAPGWGERSLEHARKIVEIVHEAEDADE